MMVQISMKMQQCGDVGAADADGDGVDDEFDLDPLDPNVCRDSDLDGDDCTNAGQESLGGDLANDGDDADQDGVRDFGDIRSIQRTPTRRI